MARSPDSGRTAQLLLSTRDCMAQHVLSSIRNPCLNHSDARPTTRNTFMPISFDCEARSLASSASCRSRCMSGTPCLLCEAFCKRKLQCLEVRRQQTQSFSLHPVSEVRLKPGSGSRWHSPVDTMAWLPHNTCARDRCWKSVEYKVTPHFYPASKPEAARPSAPNPGNAEGQAEPLNAESAPC